MRTYLKALVFIGFCTTQVLGTAPNGSAADLAVKRIKKVSARTVHHKSIVVRDLDGTPIVLRRARPMVLSNYDGTILVKPLYDAIPVQRPQPSYYLNGEPVLPPYPKRWPRQFTSPL